MNCFAAVTGWGRANLRTPLGILAAAGAVVVGGASVAEAQVAARSAGPIRYIAAEEVQWDYAPSGRNLITGQPFTEGQQVFTEQTEQTLGRVYTKAVYREYTDADFDQPVARNKEWQHLGLLGPVIRARVGETITVVFLNKASRPYSMHPHGVFYDKSSEGSGYADGTGAEDKHDDVVEPGQTHTYIWEVPERAGPVPGGTSSAVWLYHSHVLTTSDTNSGLVGVILVNRGGRRGRDGRPHPNVDREFVTLFTVSDENASWYLDQNIEQRGLAQDVLESDDFAEGNLMHAINGRVFGNLEGLEMRVGERVRWYVIALGTEVDLHTAHWHGNVGVQTGTNERVDTVSLLPASTVILDMVPDNPGIWMFHCHVNDHMDAGMSALYQVNPR